MRPFRKHVNYPGVNGTEQVRKFCLIVTLILHLMFFSSSGFKEHSRHILQTQRLHAAGGCLARSIRGQWMFPLRQSTWQCPLDFTFWWMPQSLSDTPRSHTFRCQLSVQVTVHVRLCDFEVIMRSSMKTDHELSKREDEMWESDRDGEKETRRRNVWTQWAWRVK